MFFSFVTITYNHQNFIVQHLNSIKHQIDNYGKGRKFEIIICDDGSTDTNLELIEEWITLNSSLAEFRILKSKQNEGIVQNFIKGLRAVNGDYFKVLAGDDLFACSNLFSCVDLLKEYDIVQGALLEFEGKEIKTEENYYSYILDFLSYSDNELVCRTRKGLSVHRAPGVFFRKEFITEDIFLYLSKFSMCEDRPLFYYLFNQKDVKIAFYPTPVILYRISASSIARNKNHTAKRALKNDNIFFYKELYQKSKNIFFKFHYLYIIYTIQGSGLKYIYKFSPKTVFIKVKTIYINFVNKHLVKEYLHFLEPHFQANSKYLKINGSDND